LPLLNTDIDDNDTKNISADTNIEMLNDGPNLLIQINFDINWVLLGREDAGKFLFIPY